MECTVCETKLTGKQTKFCSGRCKSEFHGHSYLQQQDRGIARKLDLIDQMGGCCNECGYNRNLAALQFHHKNPKKKLFRLDMRHISNRSWVSVLREVKKCILLCANCHAELHSPSLSLI